MTRTTFVWTAIFISLSLLYSCGNSSNTYDNTERKTNDILQLEDGTISLNLEKADCYSDVVNPSGNTAEWSVVVTKGGRYNVWLSSATKDTTNLRYKNNVLVSVQDNRLEGYPDCDRIVLDSKEVSYPYYRCDSYLGTMYIQDTGKYNVQIISEKILPVNYTASGTSDSDISKVLSLSFTPENRN